MPTLSVTKTYLDGDILTEADLDNIRESIETFVNTTKLDSDNIQAGGVEASNISINDSEYLEFGTGNDGRIGVVSDDLIIENVTSDKDIIIKANNGGVATEVMRIDGSEGHATVAATDQSVAGCVVRMATLKEFVPVGTINMWSTHTAPAGWLLCDGSAVSRTTYADLFAVIAETAGEGDNSTTFNVPDFRGRFLRGRDSGTARDPDAAGRTAMNTGGNTGDNIFSVQDDAFESHLHGSQVTPGGGTGMNVSPGSGGNFAGANTDLTGGNETRPKNANIVFIIKY